MSEAPSTVNSTWNAFPRHPDLMENLEYVEYQIGIGVKRNDNLTT